MGVIISFSCRVEGRLETKTSPEILHPVSFQFKVVKGELVIPPLLIWRDLACNQREGCVWAAVQYTLGSTRSTQVLPKSLLGGSSSEEEKRR